MTWNFYGSHRNIYLTFDDGPTPVVTKHVLDLLDEFGARATFFCLGRNVDKYPELYRQIITSGHAVGNHSYSHIKGFRSSNRHYLDDIELADNLIHSRLFRPPYGQIFPWQAREVIHNYRIIMWDILSFDYNSSLTGTRVVRNVISKVRPGSIIVFHDSEKARKNLYAALPEVLGFLKENHYNMELIPENGK
ncbi:MAG: polysaccharide deacetylase family protein [Bacteroidales bacterium]|nr:polysaccharide deacetylase family protein [Bacteroidales bacterium]MBN2698685.1 polysaccharide deacetylase family protein [Bacteroidales bacterium]